MDWHCCFQGEPCEAIADDNADCADYEDRGRGDVPSDEASTASTADDSTDESIADKVDGTVVVESNCRLGAVVVVPEEHFEVVAVQVRIDIVGRKPD